MSDDDDWSPLVDAADRVVGRLVRTAWGLIRSPEIPLPEKVRRDGAAPDSRQVFRGNLPTGGSGDALVTREAERVAALMLPPPRSPKQ